MIILIVLIYLLPSAIFIAGFSAFFLGAGYFFSTNKEKGMNIAAMVESIALIPILGSLAVNVISYIISGKDPKNAAISISLSISIIAFISLFIFYKSWLKRQENAIRNMDCVIEEITSSRGFTTFEDFLANMRCVPAYANIMKMKLRNPALNPENPKFSSYFINYIDVIKPRYIYKLYNHEISQTDRVIRYYIQANGYVMPEKFEMDCSTSQYTKAARSISYPVWLTEQNTLDRNPFSPNGKQVPASVFINYPQMMRHLYENILRQNFISGMQAQIDRYIRENGYSSSKQFTNAAAMKNNQLANSILYGDMGFTVLGGRVHAISSPNNSYTSYLAKKYSDVVTTNYIRDVYKWAEKKYMFDYDEIRRNIKDYDCFFTDETLRRQCAAAVVQKMISDSIVKRIGGEDSECFRSTVLSETEAFSSGSMIEGDTLMLDDDE